MATLIGAGSLDVSGLARELAALPRWARPVFLRIARQIERTETFKPKRAHYVAQGFNPGHGADPLFFLADNGYLPLDADGFARITEGAWRL